MPVTRRLAVAQMGLRHVTTDSAISIQGLQDSGPLEISSHGVADSSRWVTIVGDLCHVGCSHCCLVGNSLNYVVSTRVQQNTSANIPVKSYDRENVQSYLDLWVDPKSRSTLGVPIVSTIGALQSKLGFKFLDPPTGSRCTKLCRTLQSPLRPRVCMVPTS